jgi:hypothetical protein
MTILSGDQIGQYTYLWELFKHDRVIIRADCNFSYKGIGMRSDIT